MLARKKTPLGREGAKQNEAISLSVSARVIQVVSLGIEF
jgi:flagellar basal body L-ring protein FlgH